MNVYFDTSALVKVYVREAESDLVLALVDAAAGLFTSRVAYTEARSAIARRRREGSLTSAAGATAVKVLDREFDDFGIIEVDADLARAGGALADRHGLRGFDAIHLASALRVRSVTDEPPRFVALDARLLAAARAEGLDVAGP